MTRARSPDDVACGFRSGQIGAYAFLPRVETSIPIALGSDSERFQIPAIVAIVPEGQFRPEIGPLRLLNVAERDCAFAAHERGRIVRKQLNYLSDTLTGSPRDSQGRDPQSRIGVLS